MTEINTTELAAVSAASPSQISIKDTVLAQFKEAEVAQHALAEKYRNCVYAVATTKGMQEAIAARADLRDNGRLALTKTESRVKKEVNDLKRVMADEVERLVAITKPVEDSIDSQIKAEEERKAAAKAERERIERERIEKHEAGIAKLRGYGERCRGQSIEALEQALGALQNLTFSDEEWQEFATKAADALATSIAQIETELEVAKQRKKDEETRIANERIAAELEAQRQELARQSAALRAQQVARTHAIVFAFPEPEPISPPLVSLVAANNAAKAQIAEAAPVVAPPAPVVANAAPVVSQATMKLGDINTRIAPLSITAAGLSELGFEPVGTEKAAKLYSLSDYPRIVEAMRNRLDALLADVAQAA